jgi:hypothetical protein
MRDINEIAKDIDEYTTIYSSLEMTCKSLGFSLTASPLYNFRDALSHYIGLYESDTDEKSIAQETSINEHLFRGLKDGYFFIILKIKLGLSRELTKSRMSNKKLNRSLRVILHKYKALEIKIRRNTEMFSVGVFAPFLDDLADLIKQTRKLYAESNLDFNFEDYEKADVLSNLPKVPDHEVANLGDRTP